MGALKDGCVGVLDPFRDMLCPFAHLFYDNTPVDDEDDSARRVFGACDQCEDRCIQHRSLAGSGGQVDHLRPLVPREHICSQPPLPRKRLAFVDVPEECSELIRPEIVGFVRISQSWDPLAPRWAPSSSVASIRDRGTDPRPAARGRSRAHRT